MAELDMGKPHSYQKFWTAMVFLLSFLTSGGFLGVMLLVKASQPPKELTIAECLLAIPRELLSLPR